MTNLSYNAPQPEAALGEISKRSEYSYLEGRDIAFLLESEDGLRTYQLGNRTIELPAGNYNLRVVGLAEDAARPELLLRESSLTNAVEREIDLVQDGKDYVGSIALDFSNSTRPQILQIAPAPIVLPATPSISPLYPLANIISVKAEANHDITITLADGTTLAGTTNRWGDLNVQIPEEAEINIGDTITVVATNEDGVESEPLEYVVQDPQEVTQIEINPVLPGEFHEGISGKAVPGSYVTVHLPNNTSMAGQADEYGNWSVNTAGHASRLTPGTVVTVSVAIDGVAHRNAGSVTVSEAPEATTYHVTLDANGGTINEDYINTEVEEGETFTDPYTFQSDLARPGYTLTGYSVEGTLLDAEGNEVSEISKYQADYTPQSDVTLTANWEVSSGDFVLQDASPNFRTGERSFALTDGENTYPLTSRSYMNSYREWRAENVPNGVYTLLVDGVAQSFEWNLEKKGHPATESQVTINDDGTVTVDLTFEDDSASSFIRYALSVNEYSLGVEVRDQSGRRTSEVGIAITDENGEVFSGDFNAYGQWLSEAELPAGQYTITLDTPAGTAAEINETAASQSAVATDEANVFTIDLNQETKGNLSAVYAAFQLKDVEEPAPATDAERYEPVFVDEIVLDLNRGNGKLKNPKTLIENMNDMPGGIKVAYTNMEQVDLSGKTTDQQIVEVTVTYRDGSTDTAEIPLRVVPKDRTQRPGRPIVRKMVKAVRRVVRGVASIIGSLFHGWF